MKNCVVRWLRVLLVSSAPLLQLPANAAISVPSPNWNYQQDFNSLNPVATSGSATVPWMNDAALPGWHLFRQPLPGVAVTGYGADSGGNVNGLFYSYGGASGDPERALGGVGSGGAFYGSPPSGAIAGWLAVAFRNDTGEALTAFSVQFAGEQWRNSGNATPQTMVMEYGLGADFTSIANWIAPGGNFDWTSPVAGGAAGPVDGNLLGRSPARGGEILSANWPPGETLWIRWVERNDTGNDHGLAIDDFVFSVAAAELTADLAVTQVVSTKTVPAGGSVVFTLSVSNQFGGTVSNITLSVAWPVGLEFTGHAGAQSTGFDPVSGVWSIPMLNAAQIVSLSLTGLVQSAGSFTNTASLTASSPPDDNAANNSAATVVTGIALPMADLELLASANQLVPELNATVDVIVVVSNRGPAGATGIVVSNSLPSGLTLVMGSATTSTGSFSEASGLWSLDSLDVNTSATLALSLRFNGPGTQTNVLEIISGAPTDPDSPHGNGVAGEDDLVQLTFVLSSPLLTAIKSVPGEIILCWDVAAGNFQILSTTSLNPPAVWQPYPVPVFTVGDQRKAFIPITSTNRFFQLEPTPFALPPPEISLTEHETYVHLAWEHVPGATGYHVRAYDAPPVPGVSVPVYSIFNVTNDSANVLNLPVGQLFHFTIASLNEAGEGNESTPASGRTGTFSRFYGEVSADLIREGQALTVKLEGVAVYASNIHSGDVIGPELSGLDGAYQLEGIRPGVWIVGWSGDGILPGLSATNYPLTNHSVSLHIKATPFQDMGEDVVVARVSLADGSVPVLFEPFWNLSVRPEVKLLSTSGAVLATGIPDDRGVALLLPAVPKAGVNYALRASVEATSVEIPLNGVPDEIVSAVLPNHAPLIQNVSSVLRVPPGAVVPLGVQTTDPDADSLAYLWRVSAAASPPAPANSASANWQLPNSPGTYDAYLRVRDGKGGYAFSRVTIQVNAEALFTGQLRDCNPTNALPLSGAGVSVNNVTNLTDAEGRFAISVPLAGSYLLRAGAPGFAPIQLNFPDERQGLELRLKPVTVTEAQIQFGLPTTIGTASGVILEVPPVGLLTADNQLFNGTVSLETAVFDPCNDAACLSVDRVLEDPQLGTGYFELFTAAWVSLKDALTGEELHFAEESPARLTLPVSEWCATNSTLPETLRRGNLGAQPSDHVSPSVLTNGLEIAYVADYRRIGLIADYEIRTPAKLKVTADRTINFPFDARVNHAKGKPELQTVFNDAASGVFDVFVGEAVSVDVLSLKEGPGEFRPQVNPPGAPISEAQKTVITRTNLTIAAQTNLVSMTLLHFEPKIKLANISRPQHFLAQGYRGYFQPEDVNASIAMGSNYYHAIRAPASFNDWKTQHGFYATNNLVTAAAQYYNVIDLGFARSMAMTVRLGPDGKTNVAYYVTNFRTVEDAIAEKGPIATVAMDYAALTTNDARFTKFYVFKGSDGSLLPTANLDNADTGEKPIPNLCVVCHGGKFVRFQKGAYTVDGKPLKDGNLEARFLPFDLEAYTFSKARGIQGGEFAKLNQGVLHTEPTTAIKELILGWYGGVPGGSRTNFNKDFVPASWTNSITHTRFYSEAFKTSCRTCHVSREKSGTSFDKPEDVEVFGSEIVCKDLLMPNSQRTFGIFWGSKTAKTINTNAGPDQVDLFGKFFGGACPQ